MPKRSLARRNPKLVFGFELDDEMVLHVSIWEADDYGHLIDNRFFGSATMTDFKGERVKFRWMNSNETDKLNAWPDDVADMICQVDDAARDLLKAVPDFKQTRAEFEARQ